MWNLIHILKYLQPAKTNFKLQLIVQISPNLIFLKFLSKTSKLERLGVQLMAASKEQSPQNLFSRQRLIKVTRFCETFPYNNVSKVPSMRGIFWISVTKKLRGPFSIPFTLFFKFQPWIRTKSRFYIIIDDKYFFDFYDNNKP